MDYEAFKDGFLSLSGINLHGYKEKQMKRRIDTLMAQHGYSDYGAFLAALRVNPQKQELFREYVTINVTEFFRTPEHWHFLEQEVLPELVRRCGGMPKIWSTACSTGEEPYSLAMSLTRLLPAEQIHILATDLDEACIRQAREGLYPLRAMESVPEEFRERFFRQERGCWRLSEEIRSGVEFRRLDLLRDPYPSDCDLIVCRNVLIYFTEEAKDGIYCGFRESLRDGGFLFTGNTEQLIFYKQLGFRKQQTFLYQK